MTEKEDILKGDLKKLYFRFLFPSIVSMCAYSLYIIDAVFIGRGIGREAFASYNLALPVFTGYMAVSTLLGIGGATSAAISIGRGDAEKVNRIFAHVVGMILLISCVTLAGGVFFIDPICRILGADASNIDYVRDYTRPILIFGFFFIGGYAMTHFMRNDNAPKKAMYYVVFSGLVNLALDFVFIFIFKWGMAGAGLATVIASIAGFLCFVLPHFRKRNTSIRPDLKGGLDKNLIRRIVSNGLPPGVVDVSSGVTLFAFNMVLLRTEGTAAVAAYGLIANIMLICVSMFNGIAQAMQPITSVNYGAGQFERVRKILRYGLVSAAVVSVVMIAVLLTEQENIAAVFVSDESELAGYLDLAVSGLTIAAVSVVFMGPNLIVAGFLQSVEFYRISSAINVLRGFAAVIPALVVLTYFFGTTGSWASLPIAEALTLLFAAASFSYLLKKNRLYPSEKNGRQNAEKQ